MYIPISKGTHVLYTLLQKCKFLDNSDAPKKIALSHGDGYSALKSILFDAHPVFHPNPAVLAKDYPKQGTSTRQEYFRSFEDFLQMRAYTQGVDSSLDAEHEIDIFLSNLKHALFVTRESVMTDVIQPKRSRTIDSSLSKPSTRS
jgi:hypothetical protein